MPVSIRDAAAADLPACADVMHRAFRSIAERHNFPPDFPDAAAAEGLLRMMRGAPGFDAAAAEDGGRIVGSIFVSHRSSVGGISVITVDPEAQDRAVGRRLMHHGMDLLRRKGRARQQLVQAAYHNRSLSLYAKLGFVATEMLSVMAGSPPKATVAGRTVRKATEADAAACDALCRRTHGFDRAQEVATAIAAGEAVVVETAGRITGYATGVGFVGHAVGGDNDDLKALLGSVDAFSGPGVMIPTGNGELFRWCLENGLRVVQQMTLMDTAPAGPAKSPYWPAVLC